MGLKITRALLKNLTDDTYESFLECVNQVTGEDWEIVNDDTPDEKLPLLVDHPSKLVKTLVSYRLKGQSIYNSEIVDVLYKMLEEHGERIALEFDQGRFYVLAKIYETMGDEKMSKFLRSLAFMDVWS